jgi:hypothetical protein
MGGAAVAADQYGRTGAGLEAEGSHCHSNSRCGAGNSSVIHRCALDSRTIQSSRGCSFRMGTKTLVALSCLVCKLHWR